jgi:hypothetical protein
MADELDAVIERVDVRGDLRAAGQLVDREERAETRNSGVITALWI